MPGQVKRTGTTTRDITVLVRSTAAANAMAGLGGVRVLHRPRLKVAESAKNLFVLSPATELPKVADFVTKANRRHELRALFVRNDVDSRWLPQMLDRANLRTLRNMHVHSTSFEIPRRVLSAWRLGAQRELIADASVLDEKLLVLSCKLERFEVGFDEIAALRQMSAEQRNRFTIADDGSYIHWPTPDIHLDLDAFRAAKYPAWRARAEQVKATHDQDYGRAIETLRKLKGLRQSDIDGISERQVRRIENGEGTTVESLKLLARAHGMDLSDYMDELARIVTDQAAA